MTIAQDLLALKNAVDGVTLNDLRVLGPDKPLATAINALQIIANLQENTSLQPLIIALTTAIKAPPANNLDSPDDKQQKVAAALAALSEQLVIYSIAQA